MFTFDQTWVLGKGGISSSIYIVPVSVQLYMKIIHKRYRGDYPLYKSWYNLFHTSCISVDPAHYMICCVKVGKNHIK